MLRRPARLVAAIGVVCALPAHALGLGEIDVRSKLNQRFAATIPVLEASAQDLEGLQVVLASAADFERSGIERADYLSTLEMKLESVAGGARVRVSSPQIDREPFLNFMLEARWQGGRLLREYTVLLDPPNLSTGRPAASVASSAPVPLPAVAAPNTPTTLAAEPVAAEPSVEPKPAPESATAAQAPAPLPDRDRASATSAVSAGRGSYGPIAPQETLWSIAAKLKAETTTPDTTIDQILLALYQNNPEAFDHGHFNGLLSGATLSLPSASEIEAVRPAAATARVAQLRRGAARPAAESTTAADAEAPPPTALSSRKAKTAPVSPTAAAAASLAAASPAESAPPIAAAPAPPPPPPPSAAAVSGPAIAADKAGSTAAAALSAPAAADAKSSAPPTGETPATSPSPLSSLAAAQTSAPPPAAAEPAAAPPGPIVATAGGTSTPPPDAGSADINPAPAVPPAAAPLVPASAATTPAESVSLVEDFRLPLFAIVVVLLIGFLGWRWTRKKPDAVPVFAVPPSSNPSAAPQRNVPKTAPGSLSTQYSPTTGQDFDSTSNLGDTAAFVKQTTETRPFAAESTDSLTVRRPSTAEAPAKDGDTVVVAKPAAASDKVDFDLTAQFEAQTTAVNLDANDPLSEADFHLAYGLYDEAATLLRRGLEKEPARKDLRVKLAETYFAAGKAKEFQQTAMPLRGQIAPGEWQKLTIMGRQIAPEVAAFRDDGSAVAPEVDLQLDEPVVAPTATPPLRDAPALDFTLDAAPIPAPRPAAALDFTLDQPPAAAVPPSRPPTPAPTSSSPPVARPASQMIDFDLDSALADLELKPSPAPALQTAAPVATAQSLEFEPLDLNPAPAARPASAAAAPAIGNTIDFQLEDLDLSQSFPADDASSTEDEIGTKLDLARAYADMGDNTAAGELLREVIDAGSAAQKHEAESLARRLGAA